MSTPEATHQRAVLAPLGWTVVWQTSVDAERLGPECWPDTADVPVACTVTIGRVDSFRALAISMPPEWAALYRMVANYRDGGQRARRFIDVSVAARLGMDRLRALQRLSGWAARQAVEATLRGLP